MPEEVPEPPAANVSRPAESLPTADRAPAPPLLNYPSARPPPEPETEKWSEVVRAMLIVLGSLALLFFATFGLCGLLGRGCG